MSSAATWPTPVTGSSPAANRPTGPQGNRADAPQVTHPSRKADRFMPHAEHTVTVNRPVREVFDYLADGTHNPEWRSGVLEIERTSAGDGEGATYRQVLTGPGGRRIDGDYRVTVFDPPARLEFQVVARPARPARMFELIEKGQSATNVRF